MVNQRTFDLNLLRIVEGLSQSGSVSATAVKLGLSQSAVSNALNRLRRQFNDPLFVRTRQGMQPTPKAEQLALTFHEALAVIRAGLGSATTFDAATSERRFTLIMNDVGEITFLPSLLATLSRDAPHVDLRVLQADIAQYDELLDNGVADLAIGRVKLSGTLQSELIHSSKLVVLASATNKYLSRDQKGNFSISLENYLQAPHANVASRMITGDPIGKALAPFGRRRIALSVPHATVLSVILEGTDLIATLPDLCANILLPGRDLCIVPTPFPVERNMVYQWWHRRNDRDAGSMWLRTILASTGV